MQVTITDKISQTRTKVNTEGSETTFGTLLDRRGHLDAEMYYRLAVTANGKPVDLEWLVRDGDQIEISKA